MFHRHNTFQPQKAHPTHHHKLWQSDGSSSGLRQINKRLGKWQRIRINEPSDSYHRARDVTQNIYCNDTYDNNVRARKLEGTNKNNTWQTISMTQPSPYLPSLPTPSVPSVEHSTNAKRKHRTKKHKATFNTTAPEHNKRTQTQASDTPPSNRTRSRTQLTRTENKTQKGRSSKV